MPATIDGKRIVRVTQYRADGMPNVLLAVGNGYETLAATRDSDPEWLQAFVDNGGKVGDRFLNHTAYKTYVEPEVGR